MFYGITLKTTKGEACQVALNSGNLCLYVRVTAGGVWGKWYYLCGPSGTALGDGGEGSSEGKVALAEKAYRLASPMSIAFTGEVTGQVVFDGSENVTCPLKTGLNDTMIVDAVNASLADQNSPLFKSIERIVASIIDTKIESALRQHTIDWHNAGDGN